MSLKRTPKKYKKLPKGKQDWISKLARGFDMVVRGKNYYRDKTRPSFGERLSMEGRMTRAGVSEKWKRKYRGKSLKRKRR